MATEFPKTQSGSTVRVTPPALTKFDPIKDHVGQKVSVSINGQRRDSLVSRSRFGLRVRATSAPSPRIPTIDPLRAAVPALPRRQYIPTVGRVPTE
jgi:hypothetical protein